MKKSKSSKSAELDSKMALGQTHEPSSSKIHLRGVHGRISLREMKKAARLKASWLGPAKSLAVQHQIGQIGSAGTIRREKSSSIGSASKGGSITTPRVELWRWGDWWVSIINSISRGYHGYKDSWVFEVLINCLSLNIKGVGGVFKIRVLRELLAKQSMDFLALQETLISGDAYRIVNAVWSQGEFAFF